MRTTFWQAADHHDFVSETDHVSRAQSRFRLTNEFLERFSDSPNVGTPIAAAIAASIDVATRVGN
jgi:hypothetical protein